jgi:hypothetical protein
MTVASTGLDGPGSEPEPEVIPERQWGTTPA